MRDLHQLSIEALRDYFAVSEKEGVISSAQSRMMDNATSMHKVPVRTLMTPFKKVPRLSIRATVGDYKRLVARRGESYAVLVEKHQVVAILSIFSVVKRRLEDDQPLRPYAEDVLLVEENRNIKSVFYRLRRNPFHCAVVVDARKNPVGFIRMEDVARYIATN